MLTDATVNAMLDSQTWNQASLHTAYSTTGANEVTGGSPAYARKSITMAAAASRARAASARKNGCCAEPPDADPALTLSP